ncbi:unnamed protein product [Arctia plantaginis]|uniref:Lipase domain-containing protein n=1 Tax=Arctia plantaginis TaxID=874455 RepID=A0A8S1ARS4_ARCPL|nr:unnamed protein product [Arctia plantaginis]
MLYLVFVLFELLFANAMYSSKALEGYTAGYLADCPGSNIPTPIDPKYLKYLTISVQQGRSFFSSRSTYSYYQIDELPKNPHVNFSQPSVMYIGGYMDHPSYLPGKVLGVLYKKLGYNVFLLNTNFFTVFDYPLAARNVRSIGKPVAEMLVSLTQYGLDPKTLSIVGLSLGGHTASFVAKNFKLLTGINISRITALDPSGPCFRNLGPEDRLDQSDADFVDVIETNIDEYGMAAPVGHVNFYVNGGEFQPGDVFWVPCTGLCSHIRSFTLWVAALNNPDSFIALKCDSVQDARDKKCYDRTPIVTNIVGLNTDRTREGVFYLSTDNNYPYFLKEKGLKKKYEFFNSHLSLNRRSGTKIFGEQLFESMFSKLYKIKLN